MASSNVWNLMLVNVEMLTEAIDWNSNTHVWLGFFILTSEFQEEMFQDWEIIEWGGGNHNILKKDILLYLFCIWVFSLHVYMCTMHVSGSPKGQKKALDLMEL